jgi:hypothetical protein
MRGDYQKRGREMMIRDKGIFLIMAAAVLAAALGACGNPLEGGSSPSGSVLRVTDSQSSASQDIFFCEGAAVEYATMDVTIENQSTPNFEDQITTADGTNSFVTLNMIEIDYTILNMSGTIPGVQLAFTTGIEPDGTADVTMPIMTEPTLQHIRSNYPEVGNGQAMNVRVDVTYWGEDAFQVDVNVHFSTTLTIDDFSPCLEASPAPVDLPPSDGSSP